MCKTKRLTGLEGTLVRVASKVRRGQAEVRFRLKAKLFSQVVVCGLHM